MNFIKVIGFIFFITIINSCKKDEEGFEMSYRRTFEVPVGLDLFGSHNFKFNDIASDTAIFFKVGNATAEQVKGIIPRSMSIRSVFGDVRWGLFDKVEVWISDEKRPNLTPKIIFFRDDIPLNTGTRLDLLPNNVDVRPFLIEGSRYTVRINVRVRDITARSIEAEWNAAFFAKF